MAIRYLSLFSGIEAATAAWEPLGWQCVAVAEIEPFPCAVLSHHYPDVPNLGDVSGITVALLADLGRIDVVVGGSPCQDLSVAGKRAGLAGERSGLFHEQLRIFHAARTVCGARFLLWENVPGAFSTHGGRDFAVVVGAMAGGEFHVPEGSWGNEGVALGENGLVEWSVLDAQWFGVAQRRRRVFALLDVGDWTGRPPILLEPEGLRGDSPPRRGEREDAPARALCSTDGGIDREDRHTLIVGSLTARGGRNMGQANDDVDGGRVIPVTLSSGQANAERLIDLAPTLNLNRDGAPILFDGPTHTLRGDGFDGSEDGTGRGTPLVPVAYSIMPMNGGKDYKARETDVAQPLMAGGPVGGNQGGDFVVTFDTTQITSHGNYSSPHHGDPCHPLAAGAHPPTIAFHNRQDPDVSGDDKAQPVRAAMQVRRLTATECEFLQGFPRGYTLIPWRGKPADQCPDGPRYKALGNSMAVPVMRWIGAKIQDALHGD